MRKPIGVTVLAAIALSLPQGIHAQRRTTSASMGGAEHELGVDLGLAYVKPQNGSGGIVIQTPVDVRFGFIPRSGNMMWEPRASLLISTVGGTTVYSLTPSINVLFANSPGRHRNGMYLTGGAGLVLAGAGGTSGTRPGSASRSTSRSASSPPPGSSTRWPRYCGKPASTRHTSCSN